MYVSTVFAPPKFKRLHPYSQLSWQREPTEAHSPTAAQHQPRPHPYEIISLHFDSRQTPNASPPFCSPPHGAAFILSPFERPFSPLGATQTSVEGGPLAVNRGRPWHWSALAKQPVLGPRAQEHIIVLPPTLPGRAHLCSSFKSQSKELIKRFCSFDFHQYEHRSKLVLSLWLLSSR